MMCTKLIRIIIIVLLISTGSLHAIEKNNGVHLFVLSGQSNMQGMDPETGFMTEAEKLFKDEKVVYIKVAKGAQPICRWLEEWEDIAKEKGLDEKHRQRILKGEGVLLYQPILDQYKEMLEKYPKPASVTFCWMQGERDANGGAYPAYKDSLKLLISKLRRDLKRPDMNIVIGRLSDAAPDSPAWVAMRKIQLEIVDEDPSGAWVDCDDLNDKLVDGVMKSVVHYNRPEGYVVLGQRFAAQGYALIKGRKPAENGRPSISAVPSANSSDKSKASAESSDISNALAKPFERRTADPDMPNVVFVMTDDQRRDGLGCYGRKDVHTPHIDKLAAQSVVFDNAYYNVAICMPSRVTMFTGRYFSDHRSGFTYPYNRTLTIEEFEDSYPAQLRKAGYRTGFIGKWGIRMAKGGELQSIHRRFFDF